MRLCPNCQAVYVEPEIAFCTSDGTPLLEYNPTPNPQPVFTPLFPQSGGGSQQNTYNPPPTVQVGQSSIRFPGENITLMPPPYTSSAQPITSSTSNTNKNLIIALLAVISLFLLVGIVLMNINNGGNSEKSSKENSNSSNSNAESEDTSSVSGSKTDVKDSSSDNKNKVKNDNVSTPIPTPTPNDLGRIMPNNTPQQFSGSSYFPDKTLPLTLSLTRDGQRLSGTARTPNDVDTLSGTIQPNGSFSLSGYNVNAGRTTGTWNGSITANGQLSGVWISSPGGSRVRFSARRN